LKQLLGGLLANIFKLGGRLVQHCVHLFLCQRSPQLQEDCSFENKISRMLGKLGFNRKFIPNDPERLALGRKQHPEKAFGDPSKTLQNGE
jgi:hypothetical protein